MGQHFVSLHGVGPDLLHTFHCTPCLLAASLVCGPGEWRANWGASMFKTDSTRIPTSVPQDFDRIGPSMGQHFVSLHGVGPDLFHTFHCTPWLLGSSLVCGQGEWRANFGASMFKTDSTRIPRSVALRCGWNGPVYGPALRFTPRRWA